LPTNSPSGIILRDVVMDSDDWRSAYVVVDNQVFRTTNAGVSWTDITGNLTQFGAGKFKTTVFVAGATNDLLLVGTNAGVFVSFSSSGFTSWNKLGIGLPNAPVADLDYDVKDDVLVAGTLGRGAWAITNLRGITGPPAAPWLWPGWSRARQLSCHNIHLTTLTKERLILQDFETTWRRLSRGKNGNRVLRRLTLRRFARRMGMCGFTPSTPVLQCLPALP